MNTTAPVELERHDLPAYCPNNNMPLWSSHPRVYLELSSESDTKCPYCGTTYRLKPGTVDHSH